jgi:hypothetical protein
MIDPAGTIKRTVTMPVNGEQVTEVIDKSHYKHMSIVTPSAWTAADLGLLGCLTRDGTFVPIEKASDGAELVLKCEANKIIGMDSAALKNTLEAIPFIKLRSGASGELEVEDCEDEWNESEDGDVTQTVDSSDYKVGSGAIKLVVGAGIGDGDILATEVISKDLTDYEAIRLWIKSEEAVAAGDLELLLDDTDSCASPVETLEIPALEADTWTQVNLTLDDPSSCGSLISIGLKYTANSGENTIRVDDVNAVKEVPQAAEREFTVILFR